MLIGLFGCGGFGREVMPILKKLSKNLKDCDLVFVETDLQHRDLVNGVPVLSEQEFVSHPASDKTFNIAIGSSAARQDIAERMQAKRIRPLTIMCDSVRTYDANTIGDGAILCSGSIVTSNVTIGRYFHCNLMSYVAHDVRIGDFVTFAPRVACNGNVVIEDHAYIGTGALIGQGGIRPITIGRGAIIGMGSVVLGDVPAGETWVGNPAKRLNKRLS